jgi:hypothetical protein
MAKPEISSNDDLSMYTALLDIFDAHYNTVAAVRFDGIWDML